MLNRMVVNVFEFAIFSKDLLAVPLFCFCPAWCSRNMSKYVGFAALSHRPTPLVVNAAFIYIIYVFAQKFYTIGIGDKLMFPVELRFVLIDLEHLDAKGRLKTSGDEVSCVR